MHASPLRVLIKVIHLVPLWNLTLRLQCKPFRVDSRNMTRYRCIANCSGHSTVHPGSSVTKRPRTVWPLTSLVQRSKSSVVFRLPVGRWQRPKQGQQSVKPTPKTGVRIVPFSYAPQPSQKKRNRSTRRYLLETAQKESTREQAIEGLNKKRQDENTHKIFLYSILSEKLRNTK